jgi:hypothetical protein
MSWRRFNPNFERRAFLTGLGAAAFSPFIPLLNASGQETTFPKRLILFFTPHGTILDQWSPTGTVNNFTLGPLLAPLAPFQAKINVLAGMGMHDQGVGAPHTKDLPLLWTGSTLQMNMTFTRADGTGGKYFGWNSSASVDQVIASRIGSATAYPSLEFGVRCDGAYTGIGTTGATPATRMIYSAPSQALPPRTDPWAAFTQLFVGQTNAQALERKSALDLIQAELADLSTRVAKEDQAKIAAHLQAVRETEMQVTQVSGACAGPTLGAQVDSTAQPNTPLVLKSQMDLIVSALACDMTRIASLQYTIGDNDNGVYSWLGITNAAHHDMTHAPDNDMGSRANLITIYTWYAQQFAYLLGKLDAIPEGNGTMLDNSLVVWGSEIGKGNIHSLTPTPFITAGGAAGAVQTGRFLTYSTAAPAMYGTSQAAFPASCYHNRLLVSICHAMGLPDIMTFGNTDIGTGPLDNFT